MALDLLFIAFVESAFIKGKKRQPGLKPQQSWNAEICFGYGSATYQLYISMNLIYLFSISVYFLYFPSRYTF